MGEWVWWHQVANVGEFGFCVAHVFFVLNNSFNRQPFVKVDVQQHNDILKKRREEEEEAEQQEQPNKTEATKELKKKESKKSKKISRNNDPLWCTLHSWETYDCDNTTNPEWEDSVQIRLSDLTIDTVIDEEGNVLKKKKEKKTKANQEGKEGREEKEGKEGKEAKEGKEGKEGKDGKEENNKDETTTSTNNANHVNAVLRLHVQLMDRDKDKAVKLGMLEGILFFSIVHCFVILVDVWHFWLIFSSCGC